ncbi:MAG TPA: molybdopterin-dependent oxidoreductase, partial [Gammaproteobacteria bacterium]|nr:molybdopterin-dependent oxidoreductase [Gammaproteobacteria bacterium]
MSAAPVETPPQAPLPSRVRTTCPYCGVGCGLKVTRKPEARDVAEEPGPSSRMQPSDAAHAEPARVGDALEIAGDERHPANLGRLCSKGAALAETLGLEGRLLYPEIRGRRARWDEALDEVASRFGACIARFGPESVAFYVSGQLLTEDYYVANKLMKGFIGSANIDTNSRLCMASPVAGHQRAFGADVVPGCYEDLDCADLVVLVGSNAAWCHPVLFQRMLAAKAARPHVRIVVIDPRRTATAEAADLHLAVLPGRDALLFNGLLDYLRREDALDWAFLESCTEGFAAAMAAAKSAGSIPAVARACGLDDAAVAAFFRWFAATDRTVTLFSQGVNQSTSGTDKVNAIINVHLATGRVGRRGSGPFSLTGQPNAMGGREVGALATQLAAHMSFSSENVSRVARFWSAPSVARRPGLKAVEMFDAVAAGRIKAVWIMCTNPAVTMPDADRVERALRSCDFVVVSECIRDTDTASCAHVLLPAAAWGEKSGTVTNSERRISRQRAFLAPPGDTRPDWWIVTQVARRMGFEKAFAFESPHEIFREHARLSAYENDGARAFDIGALAEIGADAYDALEPVQWPLPARGQSRDSSRLFGDGTFRTPSGRARLVAVQPKRPAREPDEAHPL